jgi:site-specific DNA recombinase
MADPGAGIYARISSDREGNLLGVARQEKACRRLAEARGWSVREVYVDDDRSAYSGAARPGYEQMMRDVANGRIGAIVAWHPDRLYRRVVDLEQFVSLLEAHPVPVACCQAGEVDVSTASGRLQARIAAVVARHESEHKAERLVAKHAELAERGRWSGGPRPYGYRPAGDGQLSVVPQEAEIVREMASRVLAGESVHAIARDLDLRGVPTARESRWRPTSIAGVLRGPTIVGQRYWHGEMAATGTWEPIIDVTTSVRLRAALDPKRPRGPVARVNWLSGLLICGECGQPLRGMRRENGKRRFACPPGPSHGGCGRIEVNTDPAEQVVAEALFAVLDSSGLGARRKRVARGRSNRTPDEDPDVLEAELSELARLRGTGDLTAAEWQAARKPLLARIEAARAARIGSRDAQVLAMHAATDGGLRAAWDDLSLSQKHVIASAALGSVIVRRATRRGPIFDPGRLDFQWKV